MQTPATPIVGHTPGPHTPGPWDIIRVLGADRSIGIHGPLGPTQRIAVLWHDGDSPTEGNARLMAAAPDLLAALKVINAEWDSDDVGDDAVVAQVRAAIAKAEGTVS